MNTLYSYLAYYLLTINAVAFIVYGIDKYKAMKAKWRIPEATLLLDMKEIMISMGNHVTTDNLKLGGEFTIAFATKKTMVASDFVGIVSAKNDPKKMEKTV